MEYMVSFEDMIKRGTCCICTKPLKDSKYLNLAHLNKKAAWNYPVWNNILIPGLEDRAVAVVCDGCQEACEKSGVGGMIKYAVEIRGEEIILHDVEELEDVPPLQKIVKPTEAPHDPITGDPYQFTGTVDDPRYGPNSKNWMDLRKLRDDKSFECCPGSKKDQKHGFFGGMN